MEIDGYALVTGAGSGIGLACAQMYAEEGAAGVAFADTDLEAAERAAKESVGMARNPDYRAISIPVDVTHEAEVWNMVEKTRREFGRIDYAVNCAGIATRQPKEFPDLTLADFNRVMGVNCEGTFNCLRAEVNAMKAQEPRTVNMKDPTRGVTRGTIVNLGSVASYHALPRGTAYSTSKHAVLALTKNAAAESAQHDIRINCLCPSFVDTPMAQQALARTPGSKEAVEKMTPIHRLAQPGEIADVVIFLSSPRSSYVTGVGWTVAGGAGLSAFW